MNTLLNVAKITSFTNRFVEKRSSIKIDMKEFSAENITKAFENKTKKTVCKMTINRKQETDFSTMFQLDVETNEGEFFVINGKIDKNLNLLFTY
jgi:glutaredoxin 2